MSYATINGERISSGSVTIPYRGTWCADVSLATDVDVSTKVSLAIGNLTLAGHVFRGGLFAGSRTLRIVGGAGGWRKEVARQAYYDPNGVRLGMLLRDAASAVGESVRIVADRVISRWWVRETAPASRLVRQLLGEAWFVDEAGTLQSSDRTNAAPITSEFTVSERSGGKGSAEIATEDPASWLPGRTFTSATVPDVQAISATNILMSNDGTLRLHVLFKGGGDA